MPTPRCAAFLGMSLDGFIAREGGALDWLAPFEKAGEDLGFQSFLDEADVVVLGRRTHETVLAFPSWPYGSKRVVVLTHRPGPSRHGEELLAGTPAEIVDRLARSGARRAYVDGGGVVSAFLAAGLLDALTVSVLPVVLGAGIRLFQGAVGEHALALEGSRQFPSGIVQLRYARRAARRG